MLTTAPRVPTHLLSWRGASVPSRDAWSLRARPVPPHWLSFRSLARGDERVERFMRLLRVGSYVALTAYTSTVATLFGLFVPQSCVQADGTTSTCTFEQNLGDGAPLSAFNIFALVVNVCAAVVMLFTLYFEMRREAFIIKHLDVDPHRDEDYLESDFENTPGHSHIREALHVYNQRYFLLQVANTALALFNALISAILVFAFFYDGIKTLTTYTSNLSLVAVRCASALTIAHTCEVEAKAQSVNLYTPLTYNVIVGHRERAHREGAAADALVSNPLVVAEAAAPVSKTPSYDDIVLQMMHG